MSWLQNRIVWKPVDGQHIIVACHLAKEDFLQGRMSTEVYNRSYAKHKVRVIMFNQPQVYIEASVRINAKEFERDFYTTCMRTWYCSVPFGFHVGSPIRRFVQMMPAKRMQ
jgi:hypothetical protein